MSKNHYKEYIVQIKPNGVISPNFETCAYGWLFQGVSHLANNQICEEYTVMVSREDQFITTCDNDPAIISYEEIQ